MIFSTFLLAQEVKYELLTSRAIENGLYDSAVVYCNKLLEINGENSVDMCVRGSIKMMMNDTEGALGDYAMAIGLDPEDPCAFFNRGNLHLHHREYEKAIRDISRTMSESRGDKVAWKMLGVCYLNL